MLGIGVIGNLAVAAMWLYFEKSRGNRCGVGFGANQEDSLLQDDVEMQERAYNGADAIYEFM